MNKYCFFILFVAFLSVAFAKKPTKKAHKHVHKHLILPKAKRGKTVVAKSAPTAAKPTSNAPIWEPDVVWTIDGSEWDKPLTPTLSKDEELTASIKYLCQKMNINELLDSVTFLTDNHLALPLAAMKEGKRYVLYSPEALNSPKLKKQLSGIVYQLTHHALKHQGKEPKEKSMLAADSTFAYWQYAAKGMISSRYGTYLIDSLPATQASLVPSAAKRKAALSAGKKAAQNPKISPQTAALLKQQSAEVARLKKRRKGIFALIFVAGMMILGGITYFFTRKIQH